MRKKDLKFLVKSILKEIRDYNISKDKEVLLYDFYVLSYIRTLNFDSSKPSKISGFADEPDKYGGFFGKDPEELKSVISDAEKKLIPVLKKDLLHAVYYSICCEMRHALDKKQNVDTDYPEFKKRHPKAYEYVKQLQSAWNSSGESFSRIESFKVANDIFSENDRYEFVKASGEIFENWKWSSMYGGENWKNICDAWLYLDKAGSIMESIVCIDNLYHQQHNTGSVLNKVVSYSKSGYSKSGSYAWLAKALEDKAVNWWNTPWKLLPKCSSDMRRIALMAFKKAGVNIGNVDPSQFLTNKQKPSSKPLQNVINSQSKKRSDNLKLAKTVAESDNLKLAKTVAEVVKDKYYNNKLKEIAEINNIPVDSDSFRISFKMAAAGASYNIRVKSMGNPTTEGYWLMDDFGKSKVSTIAELEKTIINEYLNPYISNFYNGLPQYDSYKLNPDRIKTTPKKNDKQKLLEVIQSIRDEYISNNFYDIGNITTAVFDQFTENWKYGLTIKFRTKNVINFMTDIVYPFPNDKQKAKSYKTYFFKNDIKYSEYDSDNLEILRDIYIIRINEELINEGYPEKYNLQSDIYT